MSVGSSPGPRAWLESRLPISAAWELLRHKEVPQHRFSVLYFLGGITLFLFGVQVLTGILLVLYYQPSAETAFESVQFLMASVPFGWLIRSVHAWSANLMIFFAFVHLATVFFTKAYRPPRELTWMTGCVALFLTLGFGFSGYLLPWNELAFFATKVGTQIAGSLPVVGDWLVRFLRGGDRVTGETLTRFYGWHVALLPALMTLALGLHLLLVQVHGMSVPPGAEEEARRHRAMRFVPHFALRELLGWLIALAALGALAALAPWELGTKADPFAPAPAEIRPDWYFMFMYEALKWVPGGSIGGVALEDLVVVGFAVGAVLLLLVPVLDRGAARRGRSPVVSAIGVVVLLYAVGATAWGYRSWLPVAVVAATAAGIGVFAKIAGPVRASR